MGFIFRSILFLVFAGLLLISGCTGPAADEGKYGETAFPNGSARVNPKKGKQLTLKLVVNDTYCKKTACLCVHNLASREYDELLSRLRRDYRIDLQLTYCMEEKDVEKLLRTNRYDGAICKPWFAFQLLPESRHRFTRVADVLDPFDNSLLGAIFIVPKESSIEKPEDINGRILALGKEDSYEKYHLAMEQMELEGIKPGKMLKRSVCSEGINLLLDHQADVAVISDYALFASCAADFADEDAFRTIWKTPDIPLCSVILDLNRVKRRQAARLQSALLDLSGDRCPGRFASQGFIKPVSWIPKPFDENIN